MEPTDFATPMLRAQQLVPDYVQRDLQARMGRLQLQGQGLQNQQAQAQLDAQKAAVAEEQSFHHDMTQAMLNPNAKAFATVLGNHPKFHEQTKAAWDTLATDKQTGDLRDMSSIYAAGQNGQYDLAKGILQRRMDAEKAAGQEVDPTDQAIFAAFDSGDAVQQKAALGIVGTHVSAIVGPDKFAATLGALGKGGEPDGKVVGRAIGHYGADGKWTVDYRDPDPVQMREIKVTDANGQETTQFVPVGGGGGQGSGSTGGNPGSTSNAPLDPKKFYKDFVLPHEGGYAPHDANGAPVNHGINQSANPGVDVKNLSEDGAAQIFADKYWNASGAANLPPALAAVHADTYFINPKRAQQFLQQSGGDPAKYLAMRRGWMASLVANDPDKYGKYEKAWSNRNRDLAKYSQQAGGGQAPADAVAAPAGAPNSYVTKPGGSNMSDAAIDNAARVYNMTGSIPPSLGRNGTIQQKILSRAAELQTGDTGDTLADRASRKADTAALVALQRSSSQVLAFENTALRNGALALRTAGRVGNGNVPVFNSWVNAGRKATGDPQVVAMNAAVETFANEYAKVVSGATNGAVTSDSARSHANALINSTMSPQQLLSVIHTLSTDMENRRKGLEGQRKELLGRISGHGAATAPGAKGFRIVKIIPGPGR